MPALAPTLDFRELIAADGDELSTDSLKVASFHQKRHDNVVQLIRQRIADAGEWGFLNFKDTRYINDQNGQTYPMYVMTKDAYQFLVAKLTGKKAVAHQIAFIRAFNDMAAYIKSVQCQYDAKQIEFRSRAAKISAAAREMRHWQDEKPMRLGEMNSMQAQMRLPLLPRPTETLFTTSATTAQS